MTAQKLAPILLVLALGLVASRLVVSAAPAALPPAPATSDPVDVLVRSVMTQLHVPGMAIAIVRDGTVDKLAGYGVANLEWQIPVTEDTRFQLASATKVFTGTLVMLLVQDGLLALDAPVSRYLPDAPAAWRSITVAHLAAHASGIPDTWDRAATTTVDATTDLMSKPLAFPVGTKAMYGNADFIVLARVLEIASGHRFEDLLRTRLVEPLGLSCTSFEHATESGLTRTADVVPARASVYRWDHDQQRTAWFLYPVPTYAAGGLFSCARDLVTWAVAMDRGKLLTSESERLASTAFRLADGSDGGFGVAFAVGTLRGHRSYGHNGGPALADIVRIPDSRLTVIVLANQQRVHPNLAPAIAQLRITPRPDPSQIEDDQPAATRILRVVLGQLATGKLDATAFTPAVRGEIVPALVDWGPVMTAVLPRLDRLSLIGDRRDGARRIRRYVAHYGALAVTWLVTFDQDGRISELEQRIE